MFKQYLETALISKKKKTFRTDLKIYFFSKIIGNKFGVQRYTVEFTSAKRQFDWLEILLAYDKSDQQLTLYDAEVAATNLGKLKIKNITNTNSISNDLAFDLTDDDHKHLWYIQFVAFHCNGCSVSAINQLCKWPNLSGITKRKQLLFCKWWKVVYWSKRQ